MSGMYQRHGNPHWQQFIWAQQICSKTGNEVRISKTKHKYYKYHTCFLKENRSVWTCAPEQTLRSKPRLSTPIRATSCHTWQKDIRWSSQWDRDITLNSDVVQVLQLHVNASNRPQEGYGLCSRIRKITTNE